MYNFNQPTTFKKTKELFEIDISLDLYNKSKLR